MHIHSAHETFSASASESEVNMSVRPRRYLSGLHVAFLNLASGQSHGTFPCRQKGQLVSASLSAWPVSRGWNFPFLLNKALPSATLGAEAPCPGTAKLPCFYQASAGGRREAGPYPAHYPCFHLTESFPLQSGYSPAVLFALELHFQFRKSPFYRNTALQQPLRSVCFILTGDSSNAGVAFLPFAELNLFQCTAPYSSQDFQS